MLNAINLVIINVIFSLLTIKNNKASIITKMIFFLNLFLVILVLGTRDLMHGDTRAYVEYYNNYMESTDRKFEYFFNGLTFFSRKLGVSSRSYLVEILVIYFWGLQSSFKRISDSLSQNNYLFPFFIFVSTYAMYYHSTEAIRDGLSMVFIMFSISFFIKERDFKVFLSIIIASLFHKFSIIFLSVFLIKNLKLSNIFKITYVIFVLSFFVQNYIGLLFLKLGFSDIVLRLNLYQNLGESKTVILRNIILLVGIFLINIFFKKKNINLAEEKYLKYFLISCIICFSLIMFKEANRRFLIKMTYFIPYIICIMLNYFNRRSKWILYIVTVFLTLAYSNLFLVNYKALVGLLDLK